MRCGNVVGIKYYPCKVFTCMCTYNTVYVHITLSLQPTSPMLLDHLSPCLPLMFQAWICLVALFNTIPRRYSHINGYLYGIGAKVRQQLQSEAIRSAKWSDKSTAAVNSFNICQTSVKHILYEVVFRYIYHASLYTKPHNIRQAADSSRCELEHKDERDKKLILPALYRYKH